MLEKIYIKFDDEEYQYIYDDIFLDLEDNLEELNISKKLPIYLILGSEICGFNKTLDKEIARKFKNILSENYNLKKVFTIYDFILGKTCIILNDYSIKIDEGIEKIDFVLSDYEKDQDFIGYSLILGGDKLKEYLFNQDVYKKSFLNISQIILYIYFIASFFFFILLFIFTDNKYDTKNIENEIKVLEKSLEEKKEKRYEVKKENVEIKPKISNPFKKPFYMDIEFFLNTNVYGLSYTGIEYDDDIWKVKGEVKDIKGLELFEKKLEKYFDKLSVVELKDKDEGISFIYEFENKEV